MRSRLNNAKWIWLKQDKDAEHQYVCFRKRFSADYGSGGTLYVSADSDFVAFINGCEIGRGQFSDYPTEKTYSEFSLEPFTTPGENVLCVLAYYCGSDFSTYRKGPPGVIVELKTTAFEVISDHSWKCLQSAAFQSGGLPPVTPQLGFVTKFDARLDSDWTNPVFNDSSWPNAQICEKGVGGFREKLSLRPVPPLLMGPRIPVQVVMQGNILRKNELSTFADSVAQDLMEHYQLSDIIEGFDEEYCEKIPVLDGTMEATLKLRMPDDSGHGVYLIVDLLAESVGLIDLELTAAAGTVIDISHGEHLLDGKVRNKIGDRNFTDRYICKDGLNYYLMPFRRIGARYIQLNITQISCSTSIHYVGIRPIEVQLPTPCYFQSGDTLMDRTDTIAVRTLELCMHEHYEDCPWREQALYSYDSRSQMLFGYYVWGNYDFAATSLDLLGRGIRPDGLLELCAPAKVGVTIPIFSFVWVSALKEYWLHSGNNALFHKFDQQIEFMIGKIQELHDPQSGLYRLNANKEMWHFYEWVPGLSGENVCADEYHAAYNIYIYEMLCSYTEMLRLSDHALKAARYLTMSIELKGAFNRIFWDPSHQCYATKLICGKLQEYHDHIQVLAVYNHIVPEDKLSFLLQAVYSKSFNPMTFSPMPYMVRSLMVQTYSARKYVEAELSRNFDPIVLAGATSLWETQTGAADFDGAGSLCHAWSSLPAYYHRAWVLGVRPLEPGFKIFMLSPYPGKNTAAKGKVATPSGTIEVEWYQSDEGLHLEASGPENLLPVFAPFEEVRIIRATYNKELIPRASPSRDEPNMQIQ
ncbi:MAG: family 78 glycoside hydrolase catalytic domain [Chloroflexota bacterium]